MGLCREHRQGSTGLEGRCSDAHLQQATAARLAQRELHDRLHGLHARQQRLAPVRLFGCARRAVARAVHEQFGDSQHVRIRLLLEAAREQEAARVAQAPDVWPLQLRPASASLCSSAGTSTRGLQEALRGGLRQRDTTRDKRGVERALHALSHLRRC